MYYAATQYTCRLCACVWMPRLCVYPVHLEAVCMRMDAACVLRRFSQPMEPPQRLLISGGTAIETVTILMCSRVKKNANR